VLERRVLRVEPSQYVSHVTRRLVVASQLASCFELISPPLPSGLSVLKRNETKQASAGMPLWDSLLWHALCDLQLGGKGRGFKGSRLPPAGAKDMAKLNQYEKKLATNLLTPGVWVRPGDIPPPPSRTLGLLRNRANIAQFALKTDLQNSSTCVFKGCP
jgi:hypothetical protein